MQHLTDRILFGAAYYHEYQPTSRLGSRDLAEDLRLMKAAGFTVIRVGESVWSTWEPENGVFDLDWLQPVLDGAHEHGISVVLGTPTYAVPMWLARQYPEINAHRATGQPVGWGARQEIDYSHPAFLFHAERVIRRIVERYAAHPAVIGFQVDNEPGNEILHNRQVFERFVDRLRATYGTVEALNDEWGLTYWSHRLSTWADLWTPDGNAQPQYDLAWRRFQASITTDFIGWQADLVRGITERIGRDDQFVTTCISYERATVQDEELVRRLDVTAGNPYYRMQDGLELPDARPFDQHWTTSGTWALYATADRMYGSKQAPFLVTETDAQAIGMSWSNEPAFDGQWRQAAWALVSRGATMIEYWHWHTLHHGVETYWGGVLPHSQEPGRTYEQIAALGADFAAAGDRVTELVPDSDVAILFSNESKWALEEHPAFSDSAQGGDAARGVPQPDRRSFQTARDAFARGAFDAGLQASTVHPSQLTAVPAAEYAAAHPVLVAAAFTIADDSELQWLEAYAAAGGHLIVGVRTGYEDEEGRARLQRKPAFLAEAAGVHYDEFANLAVPVPVDAESGFALPEGARATVWADGVQVDDATVLVRYRHPHYGRFAAVTTRAHGAGRVTYVGTVPDLELARALMEWAVSKSSAVSTPWRAASPSQTVTSATNRHGERVRFVHNWSWEPSTFALPEAVEDVLSGEASSAGDVLELGPWDVRVLVSRD
ncbi:beta-galactosidase [Rathayibacter sp. Leaf296]|uniref:beta-galactosidase n=1 Tax=Rathayibacter sp. Leaf296 TaxID=1736327 RepID=UPI0007033E83|nr:beta-galactosidase [Rathayibacter sp. Leaf296]KQQ07402.1 beta-galactosidase [Rathayibacter sp. Leaf296]